MRQYGSLDIDGCNTYIRISGATFNGDIEIIYGSEDVYTSDDFIDSGAEETFISGTVTVTSSYYDVDAIDTDSEFTDG